MRPEAFFDSVGVLSGFATCPGWQAQGLKTKPVERALQTYSTTIL
jgi:hypothetical protein